MCIAPVNAGFEEDERRFLLVLSWRFWAFIPSTWAAAGDRRPGSAAR
ncbi:MAG: hypothetical protein ACYCZP_10210 [Acidimicrobiales bacterium]